MTGSHPAVQAREQCHASSRTSVYGQCNCSRNSRLRDRSFCRGVSGSGKYRVQRNQLATSWLMNYEPLSESNTRSGNGNLPSKAATAMMIHLDALLRIDAFSVHPLTRSVIVSVRENSPWNVGPQWATVSASIAPGVVAGSSPTLLNPIELRSNGEGLVVLMPRNCIEVRADARPIDRCCTHRLQLCDGLRCREFFVEVPSCSKQRQQQLSHHNKTLPAGHAHERPHLLQQQP